LSLSAALFLLAFHLFAEFVVLIDGSLKEDVTTHQPPCYVCIY